MFELDNGKIHLSLSCDAQNLEIHSNGVTYRSSNYLYAVYGISVPLDILRYGRCQVQPCENGLEIKIDNIIWYARFPGHGYIKPEPSPELSLTFRILLEDDEVIFVTEVPENLDEELLQIDFPHDVLSWNTSDAGEFVSCVHSMGSLYSYPSVEKQDLYAQPILPVAGFFNAEGGMGIRTSKEYDSILRFRSNIYPSAGSCGFVHEFNKGKSEYARTVRMRFFPAGSNYVDLAKWHRKSVIREGRFVSLQEKIQEYPEIAKLAGSVIWKHNTYACKVLPEGVERDYSLYVRSEAAAEAEGKLGNWTSYEVFDAASAAGFDRLCILNTGWNAYGFDSGYPTRFPVNPQRGSYEEFKAAAEYGRSLSDGFIFSVHDNYRDVYRNSPEFSWDEILRNADQVPVKGDIWRGGRSYLICPECSRKYARRDLPRIAEMCGRGAIYLDVQGCVDLQNCYSPLHGGNRADDAAWRVEIFREAARHIGAVATEGGPMEFAIPYVAMGAYPAIRENNLSNLKPIPFLQLVYHDSIYSFAGQGVSGVFAAQYSNRVALYGLLPWDFSAISLNISQKMRQSCLSEMLSHEFCGDGVEKSVFADGTTVIANFSRTEQESVAGESFSIITA